MKLISKLALLTILLVNQPAWAGEVVNSLVDSHPEEVKLTIRTRFGTIKEVGLKVMHYTYAMDNGDKKEETYKVKQVADTRSFKKKLEELAVKHPLLAAGTKFLTNSVYFMVPLP